MFRLGSGEKKFLAIVVIAGLVFVAVIAVGVTLLTVGHEKEKPYLQATTGDTLVQVQPTIFCEIDLSNCGQGAPGTFAKRLPVPVGSSIIVSVSRGISDAPWALTLEYLTPRGFQQDEPVFYAPNQKFTFVVESTKDKILSNIEVRLPSGRTDAGGAPITRGFWSINTVPEGTQVPEAPAAIANFTGSSEPSSDGAATIISSDVPIKPPG